MNSVVNGFAVGHCSIIVIDVETLKVEMESVESGLIDFKDKYKKL